MLLPWLSTQSLSQTFSSLASEPSRIQHAKFYHLQNHVLAHLILESSCSSQDVWILFWTIQQRGPRVEKEVPRPREPYNEKKSSPRTQLFPDQPAKRLHRLQLQHRLPRHQQYSRGSPSPSFQISNSSASMWSLQMFMSIRKLWPMVHRFCSHYLYLHRVSKAHYLGNQISLGKKEVEGRRSRSHQVPADVSTNEHNDGQFLCECSYSSCYGTVIPTDQSEPCTSLPRFDEQITAYYSQAVLKRRQLLINQNKISLYSESVTVYARKFFQKDMGHFLRLGDER